jgi:hypothetical protein
MTAVVVRQSVVPSRPYPEYREELRWDFLFTCAYCSTTELEAAGFGFEIDHYQPQAQGGSDQYDNLYWSCRPCNKRKDSFWPAAPIQAAGHYVVRVDCEDPRDHIEKNSSEEDCISHKTTTGLTNINLLDLNAARLRKIRSIRRRFSQADSYVTDGLRRLSSARIDQLSPEERILVAKTQETLRTASRQVTEMLSELVRQYNRSELIDVDLGQDKRIKERYQYLKSIDAMPTRSKKRR